MYAPIKYHVIMALKAGSISLGIIKSCVGFKDLRFIILESVTIAIGRESVVLNI